MIRAMLIELALLLIVLCAVAWGSVKLYYIARRELSADYRERQRVKREAEDAVDDLENAVNRATKRRGRKS